MSTHGVPRLDALDEFLLDYLPPCTDEEHLAAVRFLEGYRRALLPEGEADSELFFDRREERAVECEGGRKPPQREA